MPIAKSKTEKDDYLDLVKAFPLKAIHSEKQLASAHAMIEKLIRIPESQLSVGQADYLEALSTLTSVYEDQIMAKELADVSGVHVLQHLAQANEMNASDIGRIIGNRALGSKILRKERDISKENAKALGKHFGLPAETFLRP